MEYINSGLPLFYFLLLGFAILMYVILDGFDLGIGILYPWFNSEAEHQHLMRSVSHVWDGNETWLVFGGVILFAAFPSAYASLTSALYLPIMLMLFGLIFRGVAFEYRAKALRSRLWWSRSFAAGSSLAAFCQGLMLGIIVQGVTPQTMTLSGLQWLTPFSVLTGLAVMAGYALLGCAYLTMKSVGQIQLKAARYGQRLVIFIMLALLLVSLFTVFVQPEIRARWFGGWQTLPLMLLPLLTLIAARLIFRDLARVQRCLQLSQAVYPHHEQRPFWLAATLFLLAFTGLLVGLFPYLIPHHLTLYQAAAPVNSLRFLLPGVLIFLPLILAYTLWGYWVFRGKVEDFGPGY